MGFRFFKTNEKLLEQWGTDHSPPEASWPLDFIGQILRARSFSERSQLPFALDRRIGPANWTGELQPIHRLKSMHSLKPTSANIRLEHDLSQHDVFPIRLR